MLHRSSSPRLRRCESSGVRESPVRRWTFRLCVSFVELISMQCLCGWQSVLWSSVCYYWRITRWILHNRGASSLLVIGSDWKWFARVYELFLRSLCLIGMDYVELHCIQAVYDVFRLFCWEFMVKFVSSIAWNYLMNCRCNLTICWWWLMISKCDFCGFRLFWEYFNRSVIVSCEEWFVSGLLWVELFSNE